MGKPAPFSQEHLAALETILGWISDPRNRLTPPSALPAPVDLALQALPTWPVSSGEKPLIEQVLAYPNRRLIVYGTLAPGEVHHDQVASFGGTWQPAWVRGERLEFRGYPVFRPHREGPSIKVQVLQSNRIDWPALDAFEGEAYQRIWIPAETESGILVGNLYTFRE